MSRIIHIKNSDDFINALINDFKGRYILSNDIELNNSNIKCGNVTGKLNGNSYTIKDKKEENEKIFNNEKSTEKITNILTQLLEEENEEISSEEEDTEEITNILTRLLKEKDTKADIKNDEKIANKAKDKKKRKKEIPSVEKFSVKELLLWLLTFLLNF